MHTFFAQTINYETSSKILRIFTDYDSGRADYLRGGDILALGNMEELTLFCIEQYI